MSSLNKVQLIGHLGDKVILRSTAQGKSVANFSIATSFKSGDKEETEWHKIIVWDKLAENCDRFLSKGKKCYVEGRIATRKWDKDGQIHYSTEIIASNVLFLSPKDEREEISLRKVDLDSIPF